MLTLAVQAGEIILRSGGETVRVEETVNLLVKSFGIQHSHCMVTPTGLYLSIDDEQMNYPLTVIRRVHYRSVNYNSIFDVNDLSRRVVRGLVTLEEAQHELDQIEHTPKLYPFWLWLGAGAGTAAGTTLLLGGGPLDVIPALLSTILIQLLVVLFKKAHIPAIFGDFCGAALATAIALGLAWLGLPIHTNLVVAGAIIRLVPGAALVTSVQDGISGDLISSAARGLETFLRGAALASGVGLALSAALQLGVNTGPFDQAGGEAWQIPIQVVAAFLASSCYAISNQIPRFAILTAGLAGATGWLTHLLIMRLNNTSLLVTFLAAFVVGILSWGLARWQHSPITLYILPGILPLLPGLTIYKGMLYLAQNQPTEGMILLAQATFLGGSLAAGVALSNSLVPLLWHRKS